MIDYSQRLKKMLLKKALGYCVREVTTEYIVDEEGNEVVSKKKVSTKHIPPDINAAKVYADSYVKLSDVATMSDEKLREEKIRLLNMLNDLNKLSSKEENIDDNNTDDKSSDM